MVNPERKWQNPGSGWERNHADSKKGWGGVNVRDKTCSKNRDTKKSKTQTSLGISLPLESGQLERWYFHLGASNGISVVSSKQWLSRLWLGYSSGNASLTNHDNCLGSRSQTSSLKGQRPRPHMYARDKWDRVEKEWVQAQHLGESGRVRHCWSIRV